MASTFSVRATIGSQASASLAVAVSERGYADLQVTPRYAGNRAITEWVADARAGTSCTNLTGVPAEDGAITASSAFGIPPRLTSVPLGTVLAITLRAGHYVYGCTNVENLIANSLNTVVVQAQDLALNIEGTDVNLELGLAETLGEWAAHLEETAALSRKALVGESQNDVVLLLDTMQAQVTPRSRRDTFQSAREQSNWEMLSLQALGWSDGATLRNALSQWMVDGSLTLNSQDTFKGELHEGSKPRFELAEVAGLAAVDAGFVVDSDAVWLGEPGDTLLLRTSLEWSPTTLMARLARRIAGGTDASPFSSIADCAALGQALATGSADESFSGCDAVCTEELCDGALEALWHGVQNARSDTVTLSITGSAQALVDDLARPKTLTGSWLGTLAGGQSGALVGPIRGAAHGEELPP
jgi:hypothetical protein